MAEFGEIGRQKCLEARARRLQLETHADEIRIGIAQPAIKRQIATIGAMFAMLIGNARGERVAHRDVDHTARKEGVVIAIRSEARRGGEEGDSTCKARWTVY